MKVLVLYRPNSEHEAIVRDLKYNYHRQTGREIETMDLDTKEADALVKLYDVTTYPAVLARDNEGKLLKLWQGPLMPLINDISFYDQPE